MGPGDSRVPQQGQQSPSAGTALTRDAWNQWGGPGGIWVAASQVSWVGDHQLVPMVGKFHSLHGLTGLMLQDQGLVNRRKRSS